MPELLRGPNAATPPPLLSRWLSGLRVRTRGTRHPVEEGPASRSYGLQVAGLAGVPRPVIRQAKKYLRLLEDASLARGNQEDLFSTKIHEEPEPAVDPLREELQKVNPDELSPREALELLYRLKRL